MLSTHTKALDMKVPAPLTELPPRILETQRLTLRALQHGDNEVMFKAYAGNSVATKYMSFPCASSSQESLPFLQGVVANFAGQESAHKEFSWLIFRKDVGECIGSVGLGVNSPTALGGGYILHPSAWGEGLATEAWQAVVEWARSQPNVQRVVAEHHPDNPASGNVMRKAGFECEGLHEKHSVLPNIGPDKVDMVVWAWNRSES